MILKKIEINSIVGFFSTIFFILSFIPFFGIQHLSSFVSANYVYFSIAFILVLLLAVLKDNKINKKIFFLIFLNIFILFMGFLINNVSIGNVLTIINMIFCLLFYSNRTISKKMNKVLIILSTFFSIYLIYLSTSVVDVFYVNYYSNIDTLNPNSIAQALLFLLVYINVLLPNDTIFWRTLLSVSIIVGIFLCESRTVLLLSLLFVFVLIFKKHLQNIKIKKIKYAYIILIIIGLLIPFFITYLYSNNFSLNTLQLFNKSVFSGREKIWFVILHNFNSIKYFIFGMPVKLYVSNLISMNFHNIYLTILVNYGLVFFLLFFVYLWKMLKNYYNKSNNIIVIFGILIILLVGSLENIIFSMEFNFLFCLLFGLPFNTVSKD